MTENIESLNLEERIKERRSDHRGRGNSRFHKDNRDHRPQRGFRGGQRGGQRGGFRDQWRHDKYDRSSGHDGSRVEITNLHYSVTTDELRELAEQYGKVKRCKVDWDNLGRSQETASIEYFNESDARKAAQKLDGLAVESVPMNAKVSEGGIRRRGYFKRY